MFLWHLRDIIAKSLAPPLPHSISLIFLNLSAQAEVRISFSPPLINLVRLPVFHFLQPSSLARHPSLRLPPGSSPPPAASLILPARFVSLVSLISPRLLLHVIARAAEVISPPPRASISLSSSLSISHYCASPLFKRLKGLLCGNPSVDPEQCPYLHTAPFAAQTFNMHHPACVRTPSEK